MYDMDNINNGVSGSLVIADNALEYMRKAALNSKASDRSAFFLEMTKKSDRICKNLWYMAGIYNQLKTVIKNSRVNTRAERDVKVLKKIFDEQVDIALKDAKERIEKTGKYAVRLFMVETSIFVFSNSKSILKALNILHNQIGTELKIHTIEAKPGSEGLIFAEQCADMGFQVLVYPDLNLNNAVANSDLVVIGADRLLSREFFNKSGTSIVLDYAAKYGKQSVIVADRSKILKLSDFLVGNVYQNSEANFEFKNKNISEISYYFERISYENVTRITTDIGNFEFEDFRVRYLE